MLILLEEFSATMKQLARYWQTTDVDTVEQTRRTLAEAALARVQEGARERALTQNRIGNAAARRDARVLSRVRQSTAWLW
ncbi:hypothetical protein ABZ499_35450 [Streptomyces sp. NPDC019990]|uniref:hypothetical protein n=1 Tax=Streptomyces sp. NPDC019990 TaxID=3154693 RepID=UPI0033C7864F